MSPFNKSAQIKGRNESKSMELRVSAKIIGLNASILFYGHILDLILGTFFVLLVYFLAFDNFHK
jgi:hypothetical protein